MPLGVGNTDERDDISKAVTYLRLQANYFKMLAGAGAI